MSFEIRRAMPPRISIIAAVAENGVIGKDGRLPWRLPADLARFKRLTLGLPVVMGRKTFESIGKPLAGRRNIVLTRDPGFHPEGVVVAHSLKEALEAAGDVEEIMVIGGARVYEQALGLAGRLLVTFVHATVDGDARFPAVEPAVWKETAREDHGLDERNAIPYSFVTYERRKKETPCPPTDCTRNS